MSLKSADEAKVRSSAAKVARDREKATRTVRIVGGVLVIAFLTYMASTYTSTWLPTVTCPPASSREVRTCVLNGKPSAWFTSVGPAIGFRLCAGPDGKIGWQYRERGRTSEWRYWAKDGTKVVAEYRLLRVPPGGCPDELPR